MALSHAFSSILCSVSSLFLLSIQDRYVLYTRLNRANLSLSIVCLPTPTVDTMSSSTDRFRRKRVAIVGSGSAGIGALWALNKTYHDVYVYEASDRFGGHTNTVDFKKGKFSTKVDAGFHVLNAATYRESLSPSTVMRLSSPSSLSQLYQVLGEDQRQDYTYRPNIQSISRSRRFRMVRFQPSLIILSTKKFTLTANVANAFRHIPFQPIRLGYLER